MTVQTKIVVAECGYASTPMHPLGPWLLRRAKGIMRSGGIPWRLCQIHSEKEVDTILGLFTILASLWA